MCTVATVATVACQHHLWTWQICVYPRDLQGPHSQLPLVEHWWRGTLSSVKHNKKKHSQNVKSSLPVPLSGSSTIPLAGKQKATMRGKQEDKQTRMLPWVWGWDFYPSPMLRVAEEWYHQSPTGTWPKQFRPVSLEHCCGMGNLYTPAVIASSPIPKSCQCRCNKFISC